MKTILRSQINLNFYFYFLRVCPLPAPPPRRAICYVKMKEFWYSQKERYLMNVCSIMTCRNTFRKIQLKNILLYTFI